MPRTIPLQVKLTQDEHKRVMRLAARRALKTGTRISAGDMLRELAFAYERGAVEIDGDACKDDKSKHITFEPLPEVADAIKHACTSTGDSEGAVVNRMLADAVSELQMEAA